MLSSKLDFNTSEDGSRKGLLNQLLQTIPRWLQVMGPQEGVALPPLGAEVRNAPYVFLKRCRIVFSSNDAAENGPSQGLL